MRQTGDSYPTPVASARELRVDVFALSSASDGNDSIANAPARNIILRPSGGETCRLARQPLGGSLYDSYFDQMWSDV